MPNEETARQPRAFRYIGQHRRAKESPRFVMGRARFAADVQLAGTKHVALVASPYPHARIKTIRTDEALAVTGCRYVLIGEEFCAATNPLLSGIDAPEVKRYALANGVARYAGEWVAAVVADSRHVAEDAAELVAVEYEPLPHVIDPELALGAQASLVHPGHGSNVLFRRKFVWGDVASDFAAADHHAELRVEWGRSSTVPIETFAVIAQWNPATQLLDIWASIQMPKFPDQVAQALRMPGNDVRVHYDVDVGGSYGVKRGQKHTVLVAYLSRKLGCPVRLIEDRLENMRGGDMHGPDRVFDVAVAFDANGVVKSMRMRALDDVGAYAGRAPLQLGKPVGAIVGPYHIGSVEYEPISVLTHKTPQEAVRGFGQAPTNVAIEQRWTGSRPCWRWTARSCGASTSFARNSSRILFRAAALTIRATSTRCSTMHLRQRTSNNCSSSVTSCGARAG
jgi:2-furoyl-CoA dehydrogenase large subunit